MFCCSMSASAQQSIRAGVATHYEYGLPLAITHDSGVVNRFGVGGQGTAYNHTFFFGGEIRLPDLIGHGWNLAAQLGVASSVGEFTSLPYNADLLDTATAQLITTQRQFDVSATLNQVEVESRVGYAIGRSWMLEAGGWLSYRLTSSLIETERILSPDTVAFPGGDRLRTVIAGEQIASQPLRYGAVISGGLSIPISGSLSLIAELFGRLDIPAVSQGLAARSLSGGVGLSLLFQPPVPEPSVVLPVVDSARTRTHQRLTASVDLYSREGGDSLSVATIRPSRVLHRSVTPLLPVIFFEGNSASIPNRYQRLTRTSAAQFSQASLAGLDSIALYHQTLNLIGQRLADDRSARITLIGSAASDEPTSLATRRAESVAAYFRDVWRINASRIEIESRIDRGTGARSVEMTSTSSVTSTPVVRQWIVRTLRVPGIMLARSLDAEAGVKWWQIAITQNGWEITRFSSKGDSTGRGTDRSFAIEDIDEEATPSPLVASLTVEDSTGAGITVRDTLPVRLVSEFDTTRMAYQVIQGVFPFNGEGRPELARQREAILDTLLAFIHPDAHVTIASVMPSPSESSSAGNRAEDVAAGLLAALRGRSIHQVNLHINSVPATSGLHPNDLPEYEFLARVVTLLSEQSVR